MTEPKKKRMGRPKKQPPPNAAERIRELAAEGHTKRGIAIMLGTHFEAFNRWLHENPDLQEAFNAGREKEHHALFNSLFVQATKKGHVTAAIFLLKARHGYREGDQSDTANKVQINFQLPGAMPMEQFKGALEATVGSKGKGAKDQERGADGWPVVKVGHDHD
ncbi:hypothetical protein ACW7G2_03290 [Luteimonas sp. A277]